MKETAAFLGICLVLLGFGCASTPAQIALPTEPYTSPGRPNSKKITWCNEPPNEGLWINDEFFSGMQHAPTIHHICRGSEEQFFVQMDDMRVHTGKFITADMKQASPFTSTSFDPGVALGIQEMTNQIHFVVDEQRYIYDTSSRQFFTNH